MLLAAAQLVAILYVCVPCVCRTSFYVLPFVAVRLLLLLLLSIVVVIRPNSAAAVLFCMVVLMLLVLLLPPSCNE